MQAGEVGLIPWPMLVVGPDGEVVGANPALRSLLDLEQVDSASIATAFEISGPGGIPLLEPELPWRRAAAGEQLDERETWVDRRQGRRLLLRIRGQRHGSAVLLGLIDESEHAAALDAAETLGSIANALLRAESTSAVARVIVEQVGQALSAPAALLFRPAPGGELTLAAAAGLPAEEETARAMPLTAPPVVAAAAASRALEEAPLKVGPGAPLLHLLLRELGADSCAAVPLAEGDQLLGIVALARVGESPLAQAERRLLSAAASAAAVALHRVREREATRRDLELHVLAEAALVLDARLPLQDLLRQLVERACRLTGARYGALQVSMPEHPELVQVGMSPEVVARLPHPPTGRGLLGAIARKGGTLRIPRIGVDARFTGFPPEHPIMTTLVAAPLRIGEQTFGSFYLAEKEDGTEFSEEDEQLLALFGQQAGIAVALAQQVHLADARRRQIETILERARSGIIVFSAREGRVIMANEAAARIMGRPFGGEPVEELPRLYGLQYPNGRAITLADLPSARALRGDVVDGFEMQLVRPDGSVVAILANAAPVRSEDGQVEGAVIVVQDITNLKELERLREEFAAVIAHDLRTPIQTLLMQVESLRRKATDRDGNLRAAALERIERAGRRLSEMVNDLLDVSRIEARRLSIDPQPVMLHDAAAATIGQLGPVLHEHPVELRVKGPPPPVLADPLRLEQVLTNLLENAAKYSPAGAPIHVDVRPEPGGAVVSVRDEGSGIQKQDLPRIFDRFYQAKRARKLKTGLGLGLYIAKALIEATGGRIDVESEPNRGSTFTVFLPASTASNQPDR